MGAPVGNQNATRGTRWRMAIERALERRCRADGVQELDRLAELFLDTIEEMTASTEKRGPSIAGFVELADRLDGKANQKTELTGADGEPVSIVVKGIPGGGG